MGFLNMARAAKGKLNARWNAGANARAAWAAKAATVAGQVKTAAQGAATQLKNRFKGPGVAPAVRANNKVAAVAQQAVVANNRVVKSPNSPAAVTAAVNANKKLNTAMQGAVPPNNKVASNMHKNKIVPK